MHSLEHEPLEFGDGVLVRATSTVEVWDPSNRTLGHEPGQLIRPDREASAGLRR